MVSLLYHKTLDTCSNMSKNEQAECKVETRFLTLLRRSRFSRPSLKERSASDRCHCHFVHFFLATIHLFVIEWCLSAAKVSIKTRITKEKGDYLSKSHSWCATMRNNYCSRLILFNAILPRKRRYFVSFCHFFTIFLFCFTKLLYICACVLIKVHILLALKQRANMDIQLVFNDVD